MVDQGTSIQFYIKGSSNASYRLTTLWNINLIGPNLTIEVNFYNRGETDFLRSFSERMSLELSILIRKVNPNLPTGLTFRVDTISGALQFYVCIPWPSFYQFFGSKEKIGPFIMSCFKLMWNYDELMTFLEPMINFK